MPRISRLRTVCGIAVVAISLSACAGTSEPARTATRGTSDTATADALVRIAHASLAAGDPASALSMLKRAHEIDPDSASILAELGHTLGTVGAWTEATNAYRQAAVLAPNDPEVRRGYGGALLKINQPALAEIEYRAARALKEDPNTLEGLAVTLDLEGRHDEAEASFRKAYQIDPKDPAIRSNLALSLALWGKSDEAIALLAPLAAAPNATARERQNLALTFGLAGEMDQAAALSRLDLGETAVRNNLAYFETLKGLSPILRVRAIMGAQTEPALRASKPLAAAEPTTGRVESPSTPVERPRAPDPTPRTPSHTDRSATIPAPVAKATPAPKPPKVAKAEPAKAVAPAPVVAATENAKPVPAKAETTEADGKAQSAKPKVDKAETVKAEAAKAEPSSVDAAKVEASEPAPPQPEATDSTEAAVPSSAVDAEAEVVTPAVTTHIIVVPKPIAADERETESTATAAEASPAPMPAANAATETATAATDTGSGAAASVPADGPPMPILPLASDSEGNAPVAKSLSPTTDEAAKTDAVPSPEVAKLPDQPATPAAPHAEEPAASPEPKPAS